MAANRPLLPESFAQAALIEADAPVELPRAKKHQKPEVELNRPQRRIPKR